MKSLEELKRIKENAKKKMDLRDDSTHNYRVVVGMATCGIAAGARPVLNTLVEEVSEKNVDAVVVQTGCIGMCTLEPIVEVYDREGTKVTYTLVNPKKAKEIVESHLIGHKVIEAYTVDQS